MKYSILLFAFVCTSIGMAQESYTKWIRQAEHLVEKDDEANRHEALSYYEKAFLHFPDSIEVEDLYEGGLLAAKLQKNELAFTYLNQLLEDRKDSNGFPAWTNITHEDAIKDFKNLLGDPR